MGVGVSVSRTLSSWEPRRLFAGCSGSSTKQIARSGKHSARRTNGWLARSIATSWRLLAVLSTRTRWTMCSRAKAHEARSKLDAAVNRLMVACGDDCVLVPHVTGPGAMAGVPLQAAYSAAVEEEVPERFRELLRKLN